MINSQSRKNTFSKKWDKYSDKDILPLWIADMDLQSPKFLQDIFAKRIKHNTYGYTLTPAKLNHEVIKYYKKKQQWSIKNEWIIWLPNLVTAIYAVNKMASDSSQSLVIPKPIYPPFTESAKHYKAVFSFVSMVEEQGRLTYNFSKISKLLKKDAWLMLANPCNPGGSVLNLDEMEKIISMVFKEKAFLLSDEIHSDLILDQNIPFFSLGKDKRIIDRTITLHSCAKTFNIPGLSCGFAIIPSKKLRTRFLNTIHGIVPDPSLFGIIATLECLKKGDSWRNELLKYLRDNRDRVVNVLSKISNISFIAPEATFLIWIKILHPVPKKGWRSYFEEFGIGVSDGRDFGDPQSIRLNFGTSSSNLNKALKRFSLAMENING
jgi:cystathionine beta-lyase